jgi:hypothetical protein
MSEKMREEFESAVIARMKEGGFLEIEVRVEMLGSNGEGYWDSSVDTYWHYWQASRAALCVELPTEVAQFADDDPGRRAFSLHTNSAIRACAKAIHAAGVKTR